FRKIDLTSEAQPISYRVLFPERCDVPSGGAGKHRRIIQALEPTPVTTANHCNRLDRRFDLEWNAFGFHARRNVSKAKSPRRSARLFICTA
ncbi:hypothetical protein, partial [Bradyrhizobium japonicum]